MELKEELDRTRASGFQVLVEVVEMFVQKKSRLPVDPPLAVLLMREIDLHDETRD